MGQSNSAELRLSAPPGPVRPAEPPVKKQPPPRPREPPQRSVSLPAKGSSYIVPENKVLPIPTPGMRLRPVSQQLSGLIPEYRDIFKAEENDEDGETVEPDLQAEKLELSDENNSSVEAPKMGSLPNGDLHNYVNGNVNGNATAPASPGSTYDVTPTPEVIGHGAAKRYSVTSLSNGVGPKGPPPPRPASAEVSLSSSINGSFTGPSPESLKNVSTSNGKPGDAKANGHVPKIDVSGVSLDPQGEQPAVTHRRTHSLDRGQIAAPRIHRRQPSIGNTNSLMRRPEPMIPEDPREHLYDAWKRDPYSASVPNIVSLPQKTAFQMDAKYNMTYAQLQEHRKKNMSERDVRTASKLQELGAELSESCTASDFNPLRRQNSRTSTHSNSTASSETGVSRRKKKRAPPPPSKKAGVAMGNGEEPPVDYDMEDECVAIFDRPDPTGPLVNGGVAMTAPHADLATSPGANHAGLGERPRLSNGTVDMILGSDSSASGRDAGSKNAADHRQQRPVASTAASPPSASAPASPPPPPPPPAPPLPPASPILAPSASPPSVEKKSSAEDETKAQDALKKLDVLLSSASTTSTESRKESLTNGLASRSDSERSEEKMEVDDNDVAPSPPKSGNTGAADAKAVEGAGGDGAKADAKGEKEGGKRASVRRLNSLLQHDIVLAAQARGAKIVKPKTPVQNAKPKSQDEIFREQLVKACQDREERVKVNPPSDPAAKASRPLSSPPVPEPVVSLDPDPSGRQAQASAVKRHSMPAAKSAGDVTSLGLKSSDVSMTADMVARSRTADWTPEQDLSDDDMDDVPRVVSHRRYPSEGFKSSIIPTKVADLKKEKGKKKKQKSGKVPPPTAPKPSAGDGGAENKAKYGSIRQLKKRMHKSVRNAFDSLSQASGKILRKQRSMALEPEEASRPPSNWLLASPAPSRASAPGQQTRSDMDDLYTSSQSQDDTHDSDEDENEETQEVSMQAGSESEDTDDDDDDHDDDDLAAKKSAGDDPSMRETPGNRGDNFKLVKRAGVAYVSGRGQIVLLPDSQAVKMTDRGEIVEDRSPIGIQAPQIKKKKKKFSFKSTVRKQERVKMEEEMSGRIREKEQAIESERLKQLEMERQFQKLRDQEAAERLQTARMHQQLTALHRQQQQQQQAHLASVVGGGQPLSPGMDQMSMGGFGNAYYGLPDTLPPSSRFSMPPLTPPAGQFGGGVSPPLSSFDIASLSEYMRMMGVQPPTSTQQWAYLLSSVNWNTGSREASQTKSMFIAGGGPDLSRFFASKSAMEDPILRQKQQYMDMLPTSPPPFLPPVSGSQHLQGGVPAIPNGSYDLAPRGEGAGATSRENPLPGDSTISQIHTPDGVVSRIQVKDYRETPQENGPSATQASNVPGTGSGVKPGIYAPVGFKPVSFDSAITAGRGTKTAAVGGTQ